MSPTGSGYGKSTDASICARKIHLVHCKQQSNTINLRRGNSNSPSSHTSHKPKGPSRNLQISRSNRVAIRKMPVAGSQYNEGKEQAREDGNEDEIRPQRADEVD